MIFRYLALRRSLLAHLLAAATNETAGASRTNRSDDVSSQAERTGKHLPLYRTLLSVCLA